MADTGSEQLTLELDRSGHTLTVYLAGELDCATAPEVTTAVTGALDDRTARIVIDLSTVTFCDSAGINAFLRLREEAERRNAALTLQDPPSPVRRVFDVLGIAEIISVVGRS